MARETMVTLKEIITDREVKILELEGNIKNLATQWVDSLPTEKSVVKFARDREQLNSVILITESGRFVVPADQWIEAVGKVSVGGNNGENQAIIRKLHLG